MARAQRELGTLLRAADVVWEVADARCPRASRNPELLRGAPERPRVLILSRDDLAEEDATRRWAALLSRSQPVVALDLHGPDWRRAELEAATMRSLGRSGDPGAWSVVVVGMPNTGKSTLLNRVLGTRSARVGARAGVTRGPQWFGLPGGGRLCDMPGVLRPRSGPWSVTWRLWAIGALPDTAMDAVQGATELGRWIAARSPRALEVRYGIRETEAPETWLEQVAQGRGMLRGGGLPDLERAAQALALDFRRGQLGAITLEEPSAVDRE